MSCDSAYVLGLFVSLWVLYKILDRLVRLPRIGRYGDRFVLVTGCGQGFGFEAVRRLERLGCHVFAGCRRQESVEKLKETFSSRVHPILMDVSNRDSVRKAFEYVSSQLPQNTEPYGVSKYGLEAFSDGLRRSLRTMGCKVLIIEPGTVKTNIVDVEKSLKAFEVVWRRAQSEGRINSSEDINDVFQKERENITRQMSHLRAFSSIGDVIDAYEDALFGVFPRARYVVGLDAKIFMLLQMCPEWFSDWAMSQR